MNVGSLEESIIEGADWPFYGWADDIRPALSAAVKGGRSVAVATLFHVLGSAPRPVGAQMLFDGGRAVGYFSGACIEEDVARHARHVVANGEPRVLVYGVGSPWLDIRLTCGGRLEILVERLSPTDSSSRGLLDAMAQRKPCNWVSDGRSRRVEACTGTLILTYDEQSKTISRRFDPPWRLVIIGGDPTSLAIASLGAQAGFETTIVRPNGPSSPGPKGVAYLRLQPLDALRAIGVDQWTAIIAALHDRTVDLPICLTALRSKAGYAGLLGAGSKVRENHEGLLQLGLDPSELERLHAPLGIGRLGKSPWEVAVSAIADVMETIEQGRS